MRITVARGTLTKEDQLELGKLLLKAGYEVSVRKGKDRDKSITFITFRDCEPDCEEEDLS